VANSAWLDWGRFAGPGMSGAGASVLTVMTMQEAVELAGCTVLCDGEEVVIVRRFSGTRVEVASPRFDRYRKVEPGDLEPLPEGEARPRIDMVASSQAVLNEFVADAVVAAGWDRRQAESALSALCELNWAAGFGFEGDYPRGGEHAAKAVFHVRTLETWRAYELAGARREASLPGERPPGWPGAVALVYLVAHGQLGAVKVGVSDPGGVRIAQHRQTGWQLVAAFRVAGGVAVAIEADVLGWWRTGLGLPSYLRSDQMPQGGWTETVAAAARIDLAATVAHVCKLALLPGSGASAVSA
jgi:hypothetical protein